MPTATLRVAGTSSKMREMEEQAILQSQEEERKRLEDEWSAWH